MAPLGDMSAASLHAFVAGHVEPSATVITDAWKGYHGIAGLGYAHEKHSQRAARGDDPTKLPPVPPQMPISVRNSGARLLHLACLANESKRVVACKRQSERPFASGANYADAWATAGDVRAWRNWQTHVV